MIEFDPGPPPDFAETFNNVPDYSPFRDAFWYDWGTIFYRGRLDKSARVLCVASDPGPSERIACRTLVGDAGQRVQGFLSKIGITRSYLCLNAFSYALFPGASTRGEQALRDPAHTVWRNQLFDKVKTPILQVVIAFGAHAQNAVKLWNGKGTLPVFEVPHPSSHDETRLVNAWRDAVLALRAVVTPDADGDPALPNYGDSFVESDYARIPPRDLPFGLPAWFGDDSWGRKSKPRHNNSVSRPSPDDRHTLIWIAPKSE